MKNPKKLLLASLTISLLTVSGTSFADKNNKEGYLTDSRGDVVRSGSGLCWHTGYWTKAMAIAECDDVQLAKVDPKVEPKIIESKPAVAATPPRLTSPKAIQYMPVHLDAATLFEFDRSDISPAGREKIKQEVIGKMKGYSHIDIVLVTGHADRIGATDYNQELSQRRADSVKAYLLLQGVESNKIKVSSKGESEPIVSCDDIKGKVNSKNHKLVDCLQPNRRTEVEIKGEEVDPKKD